MVSLARPGPAFRRLSALLLAVLCTAPTPGDIGGCGQAPEVLDPGRFFAEKAALDCRMCERCGLRSDSCGAACEEQPAATFPEGCVPLEHDGQVCLNALRAASCDDYAAFMSEVAPTTPSECNFCPPRSPS